ncbi:MAG: FAD-binding oxidoreductase [Rhizobiaceae bacterium]|nr:FAD-binding oxidoreductase [Rhizobiaceae bacterium]
MMDRIETDIAVVGAGIAGVGLAAAVADTHRVVILEQEDRPAYHTSGRSAAIFIQNYGNGVIRALSRASAPMFATADRTLFPQPLLSQRGVLTLADRDGVRLHRELLAEAEGLRQIEPREAVAMVPILDLGKIVEASYEPDAQDIDVAALHQGWLRAARSAGAVLLTGARVLRGERQGGGWIVETAGHRISARIVVNAAGAWADELAALCGVERIGLQPMRRSMAVVPCPAGYDCRHWPLFDDVSEKWYVKPESGRLLVSPAEEIPVEPHDAYVDDMILAEGLDRFQQMVTTPITHVERSWAGLRTFAPDRSPVAGFDGAADGFFWLAGQGGYGMQTAPALSRLAGQLIRRGAIPGDQETIVPALSPDRFRKAG